MLLYCQFLARYTTKSDKPHLKSRNCLNDHCINQIEILNVLKNKEGVFCKECKDNVYRDDYYKILNKIVDSVKSDIHPQISKQAKIKPKKYEEEAKDKTEEKVYVPVEPKVKPKKLEMKADDEYVGGEKDGKKKYWYELEIYMAKKCANLYQLYNKLDEKLSKLGSEIIGYSLYEVTGGWRSEINNIDNNDWDTLNTLRNKFIKEKKLQEELKDVIRPLISEGNKKGAVFDENSIIVRMIFDSDDNNLSVDDASYKIIQEITEIFEVIADNEQSILFTLKKLYKKGTLKK